MTTLTGNTGNDSLVGTEQDDLLISLGGTDSLSGGNGADDYRLAQSNGVSRVMIDDRGSDAAFDLVSGTRGLYASASLGYQAWATTERLGDDLELLLPFKPTRFRDPGWSEVTIEVKDHFVDNEVEYQQAGSNSYRLASGLDGSGDADIVAGSSLGETLSSFGGDDFVDSGGGGEVVSSGVGAMWSSPIAAPISSRLAQATTQSSAAWETMNCVAERTSIGSRRVMATTASEPAPAMISCSPGPVPICSAATRVGTGLAVAGATTV